MTTQKAFKRHVRARMSKTGESYTAARRVLIAKSSETPRHPAAPEEALVPGPVLTLPADFDPPVSDEALTRATGHGWIHWLELLDAWDGTHHTHTQIARWLVSEQGVGGWWSQSITVGYERARGMRQTREHADGFTVSATRTVSVSVERLFAAVTDDATRERWLPVTSLRLRTATAPRTARYDWSDGTSRVVIGFTGQGPAKSSIALAHERLPDADSAAVQKVFWRERLAALKTLLEQA